MRLFLCSTVVLLGISLAPAAFSQRAEPPDAFSGTVALLQNHHHEDLSIPPISVEEAERIALSENPDIAVAVRRVSMTEAHVPTVGGLDDPMAMYRGWGVPLQQPWNYNTAQNMFSLSQTLPGRGKRDARTDIARSDVAVAKAQLEQVRLEVRIRVRKAFSDMLRAQEEVRIHEEHVNIARQAIQAAKIKYTVGKVPQQDILKAQVALTKLAEHMIHFEQDAEMAHAALNTALGRDPSTPVRVEGRFQSLDQLPGVNALQEAALQSRPDLQAAREAAEKSRKEQKLARKAYVPDFTVSAGYMLMPSGTDMRNDYMVEGTMNLPWLNRKKHDAEIAEAVAQSTEQDAELAAMKNAAFGQIAQALLQVQGAQRLARMYQDDLKPQAEATLHASVIAYENDKTDFLDLLDSQMVVVDVDLAWIQAVADVDARLADLEMATGTTLDNDATKTTGVQP